MQFQPEEIRGQLEKIVSSQRFKDAGRSRRFLEFIVAETLAGRGAELKENIVGINVFERTPDYDPRLDSIVRVEAGRLRNKLANYYKEEGRSDPIEIMIVRGSYAPEFVPHNSASHVAAQTEEDKNGENVSPRKSRLGLAGMAAALVIVVALAIGWFIRPAAPETRIAVLPFTPYTMDATDRMIATQLTQKVTAEFVRLGTFNVVPSTSARQYEDRRPGVREIAAALQADILLEAKTMPMVKGVKVEVRLSDGAADRKFWVRDQYVGEDMDQLARDIALAAGDAVSARTKGISSAKR